MVSGTKTARDRQRYVDDLARAGNKVDCRGALRLITQA